MKNFVKENWYKLMIGSSMMMASFGFMIYAISPAYSNTDKEKTEIKNTGIPDSTVGTNGYIEGNYVFFVDGGYVYRFNRNVYGDLWKTWKATDKASYGDEMDKSVWEKSKLP
jgi:hypothetical protein